MYGLIHIAISVEGFALLLVFILWRQQENEALLQASGCKQETYNFPYRSGTGGVQVNFTYIAQVLKKHYNRKRSEIAQSFNFCSWNQKSEESGSDYVLKRLAVHCNYGEHLNQALWERFVCGPNNVKILNKVLNVEDLLFKKACSIAETMKGEDRDTQEFHPLSSEIIQVNKVMEQESKSTEQ